MDSSKQALVDSIYQRLLNKARDGNRPFNEFLQYYAMEKFLLRISKLPQADNFILKGALLLRASRIADDIRFQNSFQIIVKLYIYLT